MIYTLDTNVLVDALRRPDDLDRLKAFLSWALPSTVLSSVVEAELLGGAKSAKARAVLESQFLAPFVRRGRIVAPSAAAWRRAGAVVGARRGGAANRDQFDLLLACQAREFGWTLITRDADFSSIRKDVAGLKVVAPYPSRS